MKLILFAIILVLAIVAGLAVALNHFFGWKGLIVFPFILIALVWAGKVVVGKLVKRFFLGLFSMKAVVLRGATMTVHSVTAVATPAEPGTSDEDSSDTEAADEAETDAEDGHEEPAEEQEESGQPKQYFDVDVTITPKTLDRAWEPGELILTTERISSLAELEDGEKELGTAGAVQVWDGSQFGPDDSGKYPGEQRLKITFEVKPGVSMAWLHYYNEPIGALDLPRWEPRG
jgi:hypothetical protein